MEILNDEPNREKQRHGCVTAWLIFVIIVNSLVSILYLFAGEFIAKNSEVFISETTILLLGLLGLANVVCAILLFSWKKIGFWGFLITSVAALAINLNLGLSSGQTFGGLIGIAILYGILQIKKNDVSTWESLD